MNYSIELLRLMSVLLIVFTHTKHDFTAGIFYILFEQIPTYGTAILSIISGFLFSEYSSTKANLLNKKIKTLLIPFIISNFLVIILIVICKFLGYDYLNRLSFDFILLKEGLFSLTSEPINPPTYFIRDIFLLFCLISLFKKNYYSIIFIIPYLLFGNLFLRVDVILLFIAGWVISIFKDYLANRNLFFYFVLILLILLSLYFESYFPIKFLFAIFIFTLFFNKKIEFFNVGGYSYLLHLYHAPIIVVAYPVLSFYIKNQVALVLSQFFISVVLVLCIYRALRFLNIKIFTGGRL